jgi:hypothetical protein
MTDAKPDLTEFMKSPDLYGPRCTVRASLEKITDEQRNVIKAAMAHPDAVKRKIALRLSEWSGNVVRYSAVSRHQRGECACGK